MAEYTFGKIEIMKYSLQVLIILFFLAGCKKDTSFISKDPVSNDVLVNPNVKCNVSKYSGTIFTGVTFGNGLIKTYYPSGLVKSVRSMITDNMDMADSVIYNMVYYTSINNNLMVKVSGVKKHYYGAIGYGVPVPNTSRADEKYTITATLEPIKLRLLQIYGTNDPNRIDGPSTSAAGTFIMQYSGDRLLKFGNTEIGYDSSGNVTWIPKSASSTTFKVLYQYNHNKTAAHQYYITSGYSVHEYYNLAEACNWIPVQPVNLRIRHSMFWGNYHAGDLFFDQHVIDANGYLLSYRNREFNQIIYNTWTCRQ